MDLIKGCTYYIYRSMTWKFRNYKKLHMAERVRVMFWTTARESWALLDSQLTKTLICWGARQRGTKWVLKWFLLNISMSGLLFIDSWTSNSRMICIVQAGNIQCHVAAIWCTFTSNYINCIICVWESSSNAGFACMYLL